MNKKFVIPEGATPIDDCSGLIPTWVHHQNDLNRVEAENILSAQRKYLSGRISDPKKWFHLTQLKAMHRSMFGNVWEWAGAYRKSVTSIGIQPKLIPTRLGEFCLEVNEWLKQPVDLTFLEMAARIHHRLVFIHPFENGNGRFSRLVADRFLFTLKCTYPIWPSLLNQEGVVRKDYINTLKSADKGDYIALIELMKKMGASDPSLCTLFQNKDYRPYLQKEKGCALVQALLRSGCDPNEVKSNDVRPLQLAIKAGLDEVVKILISAGAK